MRTTWKIPSDDSFSDPMIGNGLVPSRALNLLEFLLTPGIPGVIRVKALSDGPTGTPATEDKHWEHRRAPVSGSRKNSDFCNSV
jgi:hypothetical protein